MPFGVVQLDKVTAEGQYQFRLSCSEKGRFGLYKPKARADAFRPRPFPHSPPTRYPAALASGGHSYMAIAHLPLVVPLDRLASVTTR